MTLVAQKKLRPSVHSQKRYGQHRRHTKPYLKTYWPYLPLFAFAGLVVIIAGAKLFGSTGAVVSSLGVAVASTALLI